MIQSFRCSDTEKLAAGYRVRRFINIERVAQRKLAQLNAATTLDFLRVPPGNRLEALKGVRKGKSTKGFRGINIRILLYFYLIPICL